MPKTVLITGCSKGGIGDALVQEFHARGLRVFATARDLKKLEHLHALGVDLVQLDVSDPESIGKAVEVVKLATGGTLDFLVNNSGSGYVMPLLDTDISKAKKMFDVNIWGLLAVTQQFSPLLIASKGTLLNVASIAAYTWSPYSGTYSASKAAVSSLSDTLRVELAPFGVKVITLVTGTVQTHFFDNAVPTELPRDSLYLPVEKHIHEGELVGAGIMPTATPSQKYAKSVVDNALKKNPTRWHWAGGQIWLVWVVLVFTWHTFADRILLRMSGLDTMKRR